MEREIVGEIISKDTILEEIQFLGVFTRFKIATDLAINWQAGEHILICLSHSLPWVEVDHNPGFMCQLNQPVLPNKLHHHNSVH
jgi:hypothetical protein